MITCKVPAAGFHCPIFPAVRCAESFGQIQKVAFQRLTKDMEAKTVLPRKGNCFAYDIWTGAVNCRRLIAQNCWFPLILQAHDQRSRSRPNLWRR